MSRRRHTAEQIVMALWETEVASISCDNTTTYGVLREIQAAFCCEGQGGAELQGEASLASTASVLPRVITCGRRRAFGSKDAVVTKRKAMSYHVVAVASEEMRVTRRPTRS